MPYKDPYYRIPMDSSLRIYLMELADGQRPFAAALIATAFVLGVLCAVR